MSAVSKETWTVASAKARFSEFIESARSDGPQIVTRNGKPAAVLVSSEDWERTASREENLFDFLRNSPLRGADLDLERLDEKPRDLDL
ncbi:type II toxin-antitoxin system Phd/YefM family antitoxin [Bosea sp. PAMC 26642]|uniref:type II toxin-antitoxin system Phd/YefM family antitoxin n=1 Tax=Bosea sp. (strain PAMC 26642) TaxID=1792307 RepID=UPI00076FE357|nr:type II toxin-antitoxin system Phd/YefM family antitoxin [Bosea sp. PAMC 26642]AMJ58973.1 prevent-host-death protein [Bosea sp. PAMC 26642]